MKILHVSSFDMKGGAARAAYRLHEALLNAGVDSQMLVQSKNSNDHRVSGPESKIGNDIALLRSALDALPLMWYQNKTQSYFSPSWLPLGGIAEKINTINPDVVHLHWICRGMMRVEDMVKIHAPIVWTLHDIWPFTGGCHYAEGCTKFTHECGPCKILGSTKENDLSRSLFKRKKKIFPKLTNLTILGVSAWITNEAKASALFKNNSVLCLPNPINTDIFSPIEKSIAKDKLGIKRGKTLVLFGAPDATSDPRKGFQELTKALSYLDNGIEIIVFGSNEPQEHRKFKQKIHYRGYLQDDSALRVLYSSADVMVVPSLQEAFGQTATEAMACGTPVVAFRVTGFLDIIDHKKNGYLADPYNEKDLANGISWVIHAEDKKRLRDNAVKKITACFSNEVISSKCINLYKSITS